MQWHPDYVHDKRLISVHKKALQDGLDQLKRLEKIVKKSQKTGVIKLSADEKEQLEKFKEMILCYVPQAHRTKIPKADLPSKTHNAMHKQISTHGFYASTMDGKPAYFRELYESDDETIVSNYYFNRDNSWLEKAKAFFADIQVWQEAIKSGPYKEDTPEKKAAELSSYLRELPPALLRFIFLKWCQYFDDYHQLDDGTYCADVYENPSSVKAI